MLRTTLRIDGQVFLLSDGTDIPALKQDILAAVQAGAAFVNFDTHGNESVSVLMTPNIPVQFESMESEDEVVDWVETSPSFDLETYSLQH